MLDEMKVSLLMCAELLGFDLAKFQTLILSVVIFVEMLWFISVLFDVL